MAPQASLDRIEIANDVGDRYIGVASFSTYRASRQPR
jgi:hypothetical protein